MFSYKTIINERKEHRYCLYILDNKYDIIIYHYIAANTVLMNKNYIHHIFKMLLLKHTELCKLIVFQYQKYQCKLF